MTGPTLHEGDGWRLRLATRRDNAALCDLMRAIPMPGAIALTQERDPDFFRFHEAHTPLAADTYVVEDERGAVVGCGTHVIREGWIHGEILPVGYVCDIRLLPAYRGARVFPTMARVGLEAARERYGAEAFYVSVLDGNAPAVATTTHRGARRAHQPVSRLMCPFEMVNVPLARRHRPPTMRVTSATARDVDELTAFLARRQRERLFGYVFTRDLLERRLKTWPGLRLEDFLLARNDAGAIVGCTAPWDPHDVKRTRVVGYHGAMRVARAGFNCIARVGGFSPMPPAGECLRLAYLTHLEIERDDPAILRALADAAHAHVRPKGAHAISMMIPRGSRLALGIGGRPFASRTRITLYEVSLAGTRWNAMDWRTPRPGFEMALA